MYLIVIYILLSLLLFIAKLMGFRPKKKIEVIIFLAVTAIFLLRFPQGADIYNYDYIFRNSTASLADSFHSHIMRNVLFTRLAYFCKMLFGEYRWFILVTNLLMFGLFSWTILKNSRNILFSLLLLIGSGILEVYISSGLRQAIAMAIMFFAFYQFLPKKKYLYFELFCIIAAGFHDLALVAAPIPLLMKLVPSFLDQPRKTAMIMAVISLGAFCLVHWGAVPFYRLFEAKFGTEAPWTHIFFYLQFQEFSILGAGMEFVMCCGILILYGLADRKKMTDFQVFEVLVFFFSTLLYFAFADYSLMSRISDFLQVILVICIPNLIDLIPGVRRNAAAFAGVAALNGFLLFSDVRAKASAVSSQTDISYSIENYPYLSVFDQQGVDAYMDAQYD